MANSIEVVRKVIDGLYVDVVDGLLKDYKVEDNPFQGMLIHVLIDTDAYWKGGPSGYGGWYNLRDMENKLRSILKYVGVNNAQIRVYMDDSEESLRDWNNIDSN